MSPVPGPPPLLATIIMDYQNIHVVGYDTFAFSSQSLHETLIDPLKFSEQLLLARNAAQGPGHGIATLDSACLSRPSLQQVRSARLRPQPQTTGPLGRDPRVKVHLRPLRYRVERDAANHPILDVNGRPTILEKREKGIDVLCALAVVREAQQSKRRVVILLHATATSSPPWTKRWR